MRDEDARELLPAWALDAVDPAEAAAVERALREDPSLAEDARALREVAALLALDVAARPPATLRDDVLEQVARTAQEPVGAGGPPVAAGEGADDGEGRGRRGVASLDRARSRARRRDRWLVAAAVLAAVGVPTVLAVQQYERANEAEERLVTVAEALAEPGAQLLAADVAGGGRAVAVLGPGTSVFSARDLPSLTDEAVYQLWVLDDGTATSAGVLSVTAGRTTAELSDLPADATIAMTVEPADGSTQPTSDPLVALAAGG